MRRTGDNRRRVMRAATLLLTAAAAAGQTRPPPPAAAPPLGLPGTAATADLPLPLFENLPPPSPPTPRAAAAPAAVPPPVWPGTDGAPLPAPPAVDGPVTLAVVGDLTPATPPGTAAAKHLRTAVDQLNLLRPDAVLTVGNLVPGYRRTGTAYVADVQALRAGLKDLAAPWYPCAGEADVTGGTRQPGDRRFEALYRQYVGPLYYSFDVGGRSTGVHVIVLDSEDRTAAGPGIGAAQLAWLKGDLQRAFENAGAGRNGGRTAWSVLVIVHRPLWRPTPARPGGAPRADAMADGWANVHQLLVDFNRRPIVRVEGMGGAGRPLVAAVVAGGERAYAREPARDGIRYFVTGPGAAAPKAGQETSAIRGPLVLKFSPAAGDGVHAAVLNLGETPGLGGGAAPEPALLPDDVVAARERATLDAIAAWGDDVMGIDGVIDTRPNRPTPPADAPGLRVHMNNPLPEPVDVVLRAAQSQLLASPARREAANPYAEGFDLPWDFSPRHTLRHLAPGKTDGWKVGLAWPGADDEPPAASAPSSVPAKPADTGGGDSAPPQIEFVIHWADPRNRVYEVVLKRRVPVIPYARVPLGAAPSTAAEDRWENAAGGGVYAWQIRGDEPRELNPTWHLAADAERVYLQVRVDDKSASYWPRMALDPAWGGLASDAVSLAWAPADAADPAAVRRIWVLPFAPAPSGGATAAELWTNTGVGDGQSELLKLDPKAGVSAAATPSPGGRGYEVTLSLPRALVFGRSGSDAAVNITVHDNDGGPRTWVRSWAKEELGPAGWGRVELVDAAPPATRPAASRPQ